MSSLRKRERKDKTTYWAVLYRSNGKQRSASLATERDARRFQKILDAAGEDAARADAERGPSSVTYTVTSWVEHYVAHNSRPTDGTKAEYLRMWARTFGPLIGDLPLDVLTRDMVARAVMTLAKDLSYKSVHNARNLLSSAMEAAVQDAVLILTNPARRVAIPRIRANESDRAHYLTRDEWDAVLIELPEFWRPIFLFLVGTGCRINEATAVQVKDVDLERLTVRIVRAWKRAPKGKEIGAPKTDSSKRTVELADEFRYLLAPLMEGRPRNALLFTGRTGHMVSDNNLRERVWLPACLRAGLALRAADGTWIVRPPRLHDLRHTHVSWAIASGARMDVVQERLGHKHISTTIGTYHHLEQGAQRDAARAVGSIAFAALPTEARQLGK